MWSIDILSFIAGIILLFVALIGGGFKIKEIEMPRVSAVFRILSAVVGIVLLLMGIGMHYSKNEPPKPSNPDKEIVQQQTVFCSDCKVWNFLWVSNGVQYEALLVFNPTKGFGKMRVKYFDGSTSRMIQEEMNQVSADWGQYLAGKNPFDVLTFQPIASYIPDNVIMNNESVQVFDNTGTYETTLVQINDVESVIKVFGFSNTDLNF